MKLLGMLTLVLSLLTVPLRADQYVSGTKVVHTRIAPVVVHRVLPPFKGVHVYQGRPRR